MNVTYCINFILTCSCLARPYGSWVSNFESFGQIKLLCLNDTQAYYGILIFTPSHPLILESLNYGIQKILDSLVLTFNNLKGIDLMHQPLISDSALSYTINYSKFNFYINNILMNNNCSDISLFHNISFFKSIQQINFIRGNRYDKGLCPYIFFNSNVTLLLIYDLKNSFFINNYFTFKKLNNTFDIRSNIKHVSIEYVYYIDIDSSFINDLIFKLANVLNIKGIVNNLEQNLFDKFLHLKILKLEIENFDDVVSRKFYKWSFAII